MQIYRRLPECDLVVYYASERAKVPTEHLAEDKTGRRQEWPCPGLDQIGIWSML